MTIFYFFFRTGKEDYGVKTSWWSKGCCWSYWNFISAVTCWKQTCCDPDNKCACVCKDSYQDTDNDNDNANDDSQENIPLMDIGKETGSSGQSNKHSKQKKCFPHLIDLGDKPLPTYGEDPALFCGTFFEMLNKCNGITFRQFLKRFQGFSRRNRRHRYHFDNKECQQKNHSDYKVLCGLGLEPILYYVVLDWNKLKLRYKGMRVFFF